MKPYSGCCEKHGYSQAGLMRLVFTVAAVITVQIEEQTYEACAND